MNDQEVIDSEVVEEATTENTAVSIYSKMNPAQMDKAIARQKKQREAITNFVAEQLKNGVDYGSIEGTTSKGGSFKSKPVLFKPGQEKIFSLFGLTSECTKDEDTLTMLDQKNVVAYVCNVYRNGIKIAEGRGACVMGENGKDVNSTIKIAEKRARMDACLSLGFSEFFTQDIDDMPKQQPLDDEDKAVRSSLERPATPKQVDLINKLMEERFEDQSHFDEYAMTEIGKTDNFTMKEASQLIGELFKVPKLEDNNG